MEQKCAAWQVHPLHCSSHSKCQPRAELHVARLSQFRCGDSELVREIIIGAYGSRIKAYTVGHVEDLPAELQLHAFRQRERLVESGIPFEVAIAKQWVAGSRLTGISEPEAVENGSGIGKALIARTAGRSGGGDRLIQGLESTDVPIGGPVRTIMYAEGQAAGPAHNTRHLPACNRGIEPTADAGVKLLASSHRNIPDVVAVDLVRHIEVRSAAQLR